MAKSFRRISVKRSLNSLTIEARFSSELLPRMNEFQVSLAKVNGEEKKRDVIAHTYHHSATLGVYVWFEKQKN